MSIDFLSKHPTMACKHETNQRFVSMLEPKRVPEFEAFKHRLLNNWSF